MGLPGTNPFCVPHFLFVGNRLHSASMTFPEFQRAGSNSCSPGSEGMQKQGRSSQEIIVQPWGRVLVPPQGIYIKISLSSSAATKAPTQVEGNNFRLGTRFLEHHPVTSQPTKQKKVTHPADLIPNFAYKTSPQKPSGILGFLSISHPLSLLVPAINLSLLQTPTFQFVWPHCASGT